MKESQILQLCEKLLPLAKKDGVEFDLHGFSQGETQIVFQKKDLKQCSYSETKQVNLRVLQGEKSGFSYTKNFSQNSLEECYRRALDGLHFSDKREGGELGCDTNYPDFSGLYDESFKRVSLEDKIQKAREMNQACLSSDSRVQPMHSYISDQDGDGFFVNSRGLQSSYRSNFISAGCYSLAVQGESRSNAHSVRHGRSYGEIDFPAMGAESAGRALKKLNSGIPQTKRRPVLFQAGPAVEGLLSCLTELMNGKKVYEGLSLFKDSMGKKLFSPLFSLYDDPLIPWGIYSKPFDGEGFAMEKTSLVEEGVLKNYLTSSFFAKALKAPHTRKAAWNSEGGLGVSRSNLVMKEGLSSFEEMIKEFPQTLLIDKLKGFHAGYNPVSGGFSLESEGFLWEKGERRPLCQFTVSGNIRDLFANILKVGSDSQIYAGAVKAPSFLVPDLMIAGK